jgi:hypothetical protein
VAAKPHVAAHPVFLERHLRGDAILEILTERAAREPVGVGEEVSFESGDPLPIQRRLIGK